MHEELAAPAGVELGGQYCVSPGPLARLLDVIVGLTRSPDSQCYL